MAGMTIWVSLLAICPSVAEAGGTDTMSIGAMYAAPNTTGLGESLWNGGGATVPGTPGAAAGCAPAIQQAHGAAYAAGVKNAMTISQSERKAPGKILTSCITSLINLLASLDIFSNAGPWSMQAIISAIVSYAEGLVCEVIAQQFNQLVGMAFNQVAFLGDLVPCGIGVSVPYANGGGGGMNFCNAIGGPLVNIGSAGSGTYYTVGSPTVIPGVLGGGSSYGSGYFSGNPLGTLLKN